MRSELNLSLSAAGQDVFFNVLIYFSCVFCMHRGKEAAGVRWLSYSSRWFEGVWCQVDAGLPSFWSTIPTWDSQASPCPCPCTGWHLSPRTWKALFCSGMVDKTCTAAVWAWFVSFDVQRVCGHCTGYTFLNLHDLREGSWNILTTPHPHNITLTNLFSPRTQAFEKRHRLPKSDYKMTNGQTTKFLDQMVNLNSVSSILVDTSWSARARFMPWAERGNLDPKLMILAPSNHVTDLLQGATSNLEAASCSMNGAATDMFVRANQDHNTFHTSSVHCRDNSAMNIF